MPSVIQADQLKSADGNTTYLNNGTLSNVTLPDGTMCGFTETTTTPTATQGTDTSYTTLTGSSVNYTPVSGSSFVVYDYSTCFTNSDTTSIVLFKFIYDGSEVTNTNHAFTTVFGDGDGGLGYKTLTFVLPSWSGQKTLSMTYKVWSSAREARIHRSSYSGDSDTTDVYTKIYRRTYSVM